MKKLLLIMFLIVASCRFASAEVKFSTPIFAPLKIISVTGATYTLGGGDSINSGKYFDSYGSLLLTSYAGSTTISLPDYTATQSGASVTLGAFFCAYSTVAQNLSIDPSTDDKIRINATTYSGGVTISSSDAIGDYACLILQEASSDVGTWVLWGRSGTWTSP